MTAVIRFVLPTLLMLERISFLNLPMSIPDVDTSNCDSRKYIYFMPTYLFIPPKPGSNLEQSLKTVSLPEHDISSTHPFWQSSSDQLLSTHEEDLLRKRAYRASVEDLSYFREVMQKYEGSHNFHNFTVGAEYGDRSSRRFMKKIEVIFLRIIYMAG
jgi:tRNA pseudouridine38-40 synthase